MRKLLFFLAVSIFTTSIYTQDVTLEGYVFESGNRGYLNEVKVIVKDVKSKQAMTTTSSDKEGHFSVNLPVGAFLIVLEKDLFHPIQKMIVIDGTTPKVFEKIQMERKPGYLLDATLAEKRSRGTKQVDAITNSLIEVFNNTKDELVMILENHAYPTFKTTFERGNHYTILIRKDGYVPKRLEAYVDIKGCILCFDGVGNVQPGVSDVLTEKNQMGTLLANIELERLSAKNKPTVIYGEESLVEILFMENLNSDIIEIGTDGQIKGAATVNNKTNHQAPTKVANTTASTTNTAIARSTTASQSTAVRRTSQATASTGKKATITGIISAPPTSSVKGTKQSATKIVATPTVNTKKESVVIAPKSTPKPTTVNTKKESVVTTSKPTPKSTIANIAKSAETIDQPTNSTKVPDYKRTSSSTNTILTRGNKNKGETLVKTAIVKAKTKVKTKSKPKATVPNQRMPVANKASINSQGESLVKVKHIQNTAEFIEADYTGYLVEILLSTKEVAADNPMFKQHGQVKKELRSDGGYSYLLGDFKKKKEASIFLKDVVRNRYPMAKLVYYVNGKFVGYVFIPRSTAGNVQPR